MIFFKYFEIKFNSNIERKKKIFKYGDKLKVTKYNSEYSNVSKGDILTFCCWDNFRVKNRIHCKEDFVDANQVKRI